MSIESKGAKYDNGKVRMGLVLPALIEGIGRARTYGIEKYGDSESWRDISEDRIRDALMRHIVLWLRNPKGRDTESGLLHLDHIAFNVGVLLEHAEEE